jgi:hypothetical protein
MEAAQRLRKRAALAFRLGSAMTSPGDKLRLLDIARDLAAQADIAEAEETRRAAKDL